MKKQQTTGNLDAIRAKWQRNVVDGNDVPALLASIDELERERDEARAQLASTDTGAPCDGHRHCCADRRRLADELLRVRAERDEALIEATALATAIQKSEYPDAKNFELRNSVAGVISQINNMYAGIRQQRDEARAQLAAALEAAP